MKISCVAINGETKKDIELSEDVFGVAPSRECISEVIRWQLAARRLGCHKTKKRSEVRGTTKKAHKQKGLGRARRGDLRAPGLRGGGTAFGPVYRSHAFKLNKKFVQLGKRMALSYKLMANELIVVQDMQVETLKTSFLQKTLQQLSSGQSLLCVGGANENFIKGIANIVYVNYLPCHAFNVFDCIKHKTLILSEEAVNFFHAKLARSTTNSVSAEVEGGL